jgi:hypothetical protein
METHYSARGRTVENGGVEARVARLAFVPGQASQAPVGGADYRL